MYICTSKIYRKKSLDWANPPVIRVSRKQGRLGDLWVRGGGINETSAPMTDRRQINRKPHQQTSIMRCFIGKLHLK